MNLLQLQTATYRRVKLSDTPSSVDATRITEFINLWYRRILAKPGLDRLRDTTFTFQTVVGQQKYGLPQALTKIRDLNDLLNMRRLLPMQLEELRTLDPGLTAVAATVYRWLALNGWAATAVTLNQAGVGIWAVSDNAADTTQKIYIEAIRLGGVRAGMVGPTTLTGTTRVQIDARTDYIDIVKCFLDSAPVGTISFYDAATNGNLLAQITPGRTDARYFMIQLYPTPSAALTITVDCQRTIEDLTLPTEVPLLPEDFHQILVHGATYEEWLQRSDDRQGVEFQEVVRLLNDLTHQVTSTPDEIHVQRGSRGWGQRISRLGGYYPRDRF